MHCKNDHAACCHTNQTPTRCFHRLHRRLCPLNLFFRCRSETQTHFLPAPSSHFSLTFHSLSPRSVSFSAMAIRFRFWLSLRQVCPSPLHYLSTVSLQPEESHASLMAARRFPIRQSRDLER